MLHEAKANGQTVFLSSHVLSEVQQTADEIAILKAGRIVKQSTVEALRENAVRRVRLVVAEADAAAAARRSMKCPAWRAWHPRRTARHRRTVGDARRPRRPVREGRRAAGRGRSRRSRNPTSRRWCSRTTERTCRRRSMPTTPTALTGRTPDDEPRAAPVPALHRRRLARPRRLDRRHPRRPVPLPAAVPVARRERADAGHDRLAAARARADAQLRPDRLGPWIRAGDVLRPHRVRAAHDRRGRLGHGRHRATTRRTAS